MTSPQIVDLPRGELHVFRKPQGGKYLDHLITREPGSVAVARLADIEIDPSALFAA
jgi:hypothetical protein